MLSRIYIILSILTSSFLFAQANPANTSTEKKAHSALKADSPFPEGNYTNGINVHLSKLEKSIVEKIENLEKLQAKASELRSDLKEKVYIADEVPAMARMENFPIVTSRRIEFSFQANKTKEVKIISSKKNIRYDIHSIVRTLTFAPSDFASIKIKVDSFDSIAKGVPDIIEYNKMSIDGKLVALKAIDLVLKNTIFRYDALIQKAMNENTNKSKNNLEEL